MSDAICPQCGTVMAASALAGLCRKCLGGLAFGISRDEPAGSTAGPAGGRRLGKYELLEEIARGGMGVVYRARQLDLNRIVAVKVILHGPFSSDAFVRRFRNEAEAVAGLQHPNIVAIHEFGEHDGHHFYSMDYVEGRDLAELVREKPLPARRAAGYLKTIAEAIDYAHRRGVLHRDLKPSNLLLDVFDQPRITDFGLAKLVNRDQELTTTGQVLGSPSHMPPEQAAGRFAEATPQSDLYSLGAMLYHLITGRPPFQGETVHEILSQVQSAPPVPPRRLNPSIPADLQTICMKCLQKEPARRYPSAHALADDLGRFLDNQPIQARPVALVERFRLWCRRRPMLAALSAALIATFVLGLAGILWQWQRAESHARGEFGLRKLAEGQAATVRLNLYAADINLASRSIQQGDYGLARRTLAALRPAGHEPDLRGFEWRYLWNLCRGDQLATLHGHRWIVTAAAFSPDGGRLVTGSQDGTAKIWDVPSRRLLADLSITSNAVWSVAFSPDGAALMTADAGGRVTFRDASTWRTLTNFPGCIAALSHHDPLVAIAASSPFFWEPAGAVTIWNYRTGERLHRLDQPGRALAFSPDDQRLAVAGATNGIDLRDVASGKLLRTLPTQDSVWCLSFSPDGTRLLATGWNSDVGVWDLGSSQPPKILKGHHLTVWSATFSPDGASIVTTGSDQTVRLWDASTLEPKAVLRGHESEVWCAAFSPDNRLLASGGKDQNVMLWSARAVPVHGELPNENETQPAFSRDGSRLATMAVFGAASRSAIWNAADRAALNEIDGEVLGFSPGGDRAMTLSADATALELHSLSNGPLMRVMLAGLQPGAGPVHEEGSSPDGDFFFAIDAAGTIRVWESGTGRLIGTIRGPTPPIRAAVLAPDGTKLALSIERENAVRLYDCATGHERQLNGHHDFVSGLAFSPDGRMLATGSMDGTIRLWNALSGTALTVLPGHMEEATGVAFSPDGRTLASICRRESVKLWHVPTGRELLSLDFPDAGGRVTFSPDGGRLAITTMNHIIRLLDGPFPAETGVLNP